MGRKPGFPEVLGLIVLGLFVLAVVSCTATGIVMGLE